MCTIMTVDKDSYTDDVFAQIKADARYNDDGWSLALISNGGVRDVIHTMSLPVIQAALDNEDWDRMFLHARAATGMSDINVLNSHGFRSYPYLIFHNGFIMNSENHLPVDSEQIGIWLDTLGEAGCLQKLYSEGFANVMLLNVKTGDYLIHRSKTGTLFTDGDGNYSTNEVGYMRIPVKEYTQYKFRMPEWRRTESRWSYGSWSYRNVDDNGWSTDSSTDYYTSQQAAADDMKRALGKMGSRTEEEDEDKVPFLADLPAEEKETMMAEVAEVPNRYRPEPDLLTKGKDNEFLEEGRDYYFADYDTLATYLGYDDGEHAYLFEIDYSSHYEGGELLYVKHSQLYRILDSYIDGPARQADDDETEEAI